MAVITRIHDNSPINETPTQKKFREYIDSFEKRAKLEKIALEKYSNPIMRDIGNTVVGMMELIVASSRRFIYRDDVKSFIEHHNYKIAIDPVEYVDQYARALVSVVSGGIISPLTGDDDEWEDVTVDEDVGRDFIVEWNGETFTYPILKVECNKRVPSVYRLNGDNKFAHRLDLVQFIDHENEKVHCTKDSIRFIKFPYMMQTVICEVETVNGEIVEFIDYTKEDITDGLIYMNGYSSQYFAAPKIPFFLLEARGINIEEEIEKFNAVIQERGM